MRASIAAQSEEHGERNAGAGSAAARAGSPDAAAACSASVGSTDKPARAVTAGRRRAFGASTPQ
jgi:hypothetical protein